MPINKNEITKEMLGKALQCETVEDLLALAKAEGIELTKDQTYCGRKIYTWKLV